MVLCALCLDRTCLAGAYAISIKIHVFPWKRSATYHMSESWEYEDKLLILLAVHESCMWALFINWTYNIVNAVNRNLNYFNYNRELTV